MVVICFRSQAGGGASTWILAILAMFLAGCDRTAARTEPELRPSARQDDVCCDGTTRQAASASETESGMIVAWIDNRAISAQAVQLEALAQGLATPDTPLATNSPEFVAIVDQLIDRHLLAREARRRGLDADLAAQRRLAAARERILGHLLVDTLMAEQVNESTLRGAYDAQRDLGALDERIRVQHILLDSEAAAKRVLQRLRSGADFSRLAREHSLDRRSSASGGDMGRIRIEDAPPGVRATLRKLRTGRIDGPVRSFMGWHILRVAERSRNAVPDFEHLRPRIDRFLTLRVLDRELERLRREALISKPVGLQGHFTGPQHGRGPSDAPPSPTPSLHPELAATEARSAPSAPSLSPRFARP